MVGLCPKGSLAVYGDTPARWTVIFVSPVCKTLWKISDTGDSQYVAKKSAFLLYTLKIGGGCGSDIVFGWDFGLFFWVCEGSNEAFLKHTHYKNTIR
mmetsp:Transcript_63553/g.74431  ORF Transcript_63553/g.74431 Transcript_63553/m.74431 type:complete len:97 (+) Transcript_63553:1102-1392(+)